jgi:2-amino-4-hydroxy-6-hydroxymethyldihydropteridine diphosphokinase
LDIIPTLFLSAQYQWHNVLIALLADYYLYNCITIMARAIIIIGGNEGDVKPRLRLVQQIINERIGAVLRCSHIYQTRAWGFDSCNFHNQVLMVDTDLLPETLITLIQDIEQKLGRDRQREEQIKQETGQAYAPRTIDIDILFYDGQIIDKPMLKIPHPLLHKREFVLTPLNEIAPDFMHPILGKSIKELREELKS